MKHFQHFGYDKIKDITSMSRYIDDFIENGVKNNLVSCLFFIAYKSGLTLGVANGVIAPLVEYKDMDILPLATKGVYNVVKERNRQNRIAVIEDLTRNFEFYGRRVGYNNEYGAASSQM